MNYVKIYNQIVDKARKENRSKSNSYYENHHILPKCLGGSNKKDNRILLTPREHFICHWLLIKIYKDQPKEYTKMLRAFVLMKAKNPSQGKRYINSKIYESVKRKLYGDNGILSGENSTFFGKTHSKEIRKKLSESKLGSNNPMFQKSPWNKGQKLEYDVWNKGKKLGPHTEERKQLLSKKAIENGLGKYKSETHKKSLSDSIREKYRSDPVYKEKVRQASLRGAEKTRGKSKEIVECPYCGKQGGKPAMIRHHFNNCKDNYARR